jgi:multiple sugar transport system permease protein
VELTNTYWAVFLPSLVSPFGVYLSRIYAAGAVPDELIEAGRLDGAGDMRIFFSMSVGSWRPALVTIYLFQFVAIWNNFFLPLIMLVDSELYPVTLGSSPGPRRPRATPSSSPRSSWAPSSRSSR